MPQLIAPEGLAAWLAIGAGISMWRMLPGHRFRLLFSLGTLGLTLVAGALAADAGGFLGLALAGAAMWVAGGVLHWRFRPRE